MIVNHCIIGYRVYVDIKHKRNGRSPLGHFKNSTIRALGNKAYRYGKHARNTPWDRQPAHKTVINMRLSIDYKRTYMGWSSMTKWSGATD